MQITIIQLRDNGRRDNFAFSKKSKYELILTTTAATSSRNRMCILKFIKRDI